MPLKCRKCGKCHTSWAGCIGPTKKQRRLAKKHGTPAEFAAACYKAVPDFIGMDEAATAVNKYNQEWNQAGK